MKHTEVLDLQVESYVEAVGRALAEVDADEREAMLDDLRAHASAVAAEVPSVDLASRLGTPSAYARELREAAGLAGGDESQVHRLRRLWDHISESRLSTVLRRAWVDFAPAWAVGRGVALGWIVANWLGLGHRHALAVLLVGGIGGWVLADAFARLGGRGRFGVVVRAVIDLVVAVALALLVLSWASPPQSEGPGTGVAEPAPGQGLWFNGMAVTSIQAFGPDGRPTPVALFDQNGTALTGISTSTDSLSCPDGLTPIAVSYLTNAGTPITNAAPARGVCVDQNYVVIRDAVPLTNGATVQSWGNAPLPAPGQTVATDENNQYAGTVASPALASPSPTSTGTASGSAVTPTPSG